MGETMAMVEWEGIESVFLDMDGTLLDLHFDNHFWLAHVPVRYAARHGLPLEAAQAELKVRYARVAGTMQWYCVDYWSEQLELDIAALKAELRHLIAVHPHVHEFLAFLRRAGKRIVLVTNAHAKSLSLKMACTGLTPHFDALICAHAFGVPKEHPAFWERLQVAEPFVPERTLLIDDSLPVLRSARHYGIAHLRAVRRPDSRQPPNAQEEFAALADFREVLPPPTAPRVACLDHCVLTVADIEASVAFYGRVLGLEVRRLEGGRTTLCVGRQRINLHPFGREYEPKAGRPTPGAADLCFLTQTPVTAWFDHLAACRVEVIEGPVERNGAAGRLLSVYFRDPDGNLIEVANLLAEHP